MAKKNCEVCNTEMGLMAQVQLGDMTYICRQCYKKANKYFVAKENTLDQFKAHLKQVENGNKLFAELFKKKGQPKPKTKSFGSLRVAEELGLMVLFCEKGGFMIWGAKPYHVVYRIADLISYEYEKETKLVDGKMTTLEFIRLGFRNVDGLSEVLLPMRGFTNKEFEKYFNKLFGIQKTLGNIGNTWKNQINAVKAVASGIKTATNENMTEEEKAAAMAVDADKFDASIYGDRTVWIEKADAAIKSVLG